MDFSDQQPERFWVTNPEDCEHAPPVWRCAFCGAEIKTDYNIPYKKDFGGLCQICATENIADHPMTPTYLDWLANGDPRWWSSWLCNCEGCVPSEVSTEG